MKRKVRKAVKYSELTKRMVIHDIVSEGISIASACMQNGIDEVYMVREWVREYMKKRDMLRIPRTLTKRKNWSFLFKSVKSAHLLPSGMGLIPMGFYDMERGWTYRFFSTKKNSSKEHDSRKG
ncbi:MAG: hypothetical protein M0R32_02100 [Candidatus Cloacimonetes bacterium]|jgi:hypothetical protein|nr:hypothetical protein [Candidatus Cloacimonadota bacterium]MCK9433628.1 hypothetical protein [Candidatus Cloacimonadota bacterium]MDD4234168.1 hypothetical protein [Candidatus Cloacimonadota bacterium]